jgi:peptide/nickel transport system permease protein
MPEDIDCSNEQVEKNETDVSMYRYVAHRFFCHKLAVTGLAFVILIILCALLAPLIATQSPFVVSDNANLVPYWKHILGTDSVGRDVFSRLIYGARVSLTVGVLTVLISVGIGTVLGLLSGYFGGKTDMIIMRLTDMFMSFPDIMLILVIVSIVGPGLRNIIIVLGLLQWPGVTRIVRSNVLVIKQEDYIKSCTVLGLSTSRTLFIHILPNTIAPILVYATTGIASAIITEASLSFLGMGVQPPTPSWGNMLTDAQSLTVLTTQPWLWVPAGTLIFLSVLAINAIGDGLRNALDARQQ